MLNGSLDQGSLICLGYAYFFSIPEPEYAYKRYAYKKNMSLVFRLTFENMEIEANEQSLYKDTMKCK